MRPVRSTVPGITYHLISRFVDRDWFIQCDEEREHYLWLLGRAMRESDWKCLAYAVMSNHLHLALLAGLSPLEEWAKKVHSPFATWMNDRHERLGPMFVRGPKDRAVPPTRIGHVIAYIHNNPVRAGVVTDPAMSTWTSHRAYLGRERAPDWLHVGLGFELMHLNLEQFEALVASGPDDPCRVPSPRRSTRRGQVELGTPTATTPAMIPLLTRNHAFVRIEPRWFTQLGAAAVRIDESRLCSRSRHAVVVMARRAVVHAARRFGLAGADISAALAISRAAVSNIARMTLDDATARLRDHIVDSVSRLTGVREHRPSTRVD